MLDRNVNINVSCAANASRDKDGQYGQLLSHIRRFCIDSPKVR